MASILLADDHEVVRRGVRALLEAKRGFVICGEARNGREAVDMAVQHNPDVVVLDISLPALNGVDATRQIRKVAPKSEILIFTMHDSEEIIREALGAGARGCLLKSEADSQIVSAVDALARHRSFLSPACGNTVSILKAPPPVVTARTAASPRSGPLRV
jgi:DNA-binding NarL/FixJ family response regulator